LCQELPEYRRAGRVLALSSRRRGNPAAPSFDEVEPAGTDDDYSTSFTEVSEALDDCAQGVLAERGAARCGNTFLDLEKSCCFSCRFGQGPRWPMLTLVVSLQAIFLSASVMIGQNRQSNFQQAKANHDFKEQELESKPTRG
jgi:hypothetical protein